MNTNGARRPATHLRSRTGLTVALGLALFACGAGEEADGQPDFGNAPTFPGGQQNGTGGSASNGTGNNSVPNNNGTANNSPSSSNSNNTGSNTGSTPTASNTNPNSPPVSNTPSNTPEGNPNNAPINNTNTMNGAMAGGAGAGGMLPPNNPDPNPPVTNPNPPDPNPPVTNPPVTPPPATPDITCPAGATFCSGFESDTLPMGASYQSQPTVQLQFDTTVKHSGSRSLMVVSAGGFNIREVVAPIPGQSFWVRLFVQTSTVFGDNNHDSLFVASTANPSQDNNAEDGPEFSEQGNQIILNANDGLFSQAGAGFPQGEGPQLSANTWHCEEAFYNGGTGDVQIFSDGEQIINAPGFKRLTYQTFRFGYIGFNTVRTVWFDDVVVAPNRVGCN